MRDVGIVVSKYVQTHPMLTMTVYYLTVRQKDIDKKDDVGSNCTSKGHH